MGVRCGSQTPRLLIAPSPEGFETIGPDACRLVAGLNLTADPWQETTTSAWMRRKNGRWCASTWGITVSRQNGKNGALEVVEVFGMAALGLKFLHTAHEVKTAHKAFRRLKYFFGEKANDPAANFPKLNALVERVRSTNGQEAIVLKNGGSIEFIARSKGSGRGFTVDVLVLDEAQELQDHELEALLPTISAAPSGDPVTIYMGTAPEGGSDLGEPFIRVREGAIDGTAKRTAWVEFSADGYVEDMKEDELHKFVNNRKNWYQANPALGIRINEETIEAELAQFSTRSFARERLNLWPRPTKVGKPAFSKSQVDALEIENPSADWPVAAYAVDMNHERTKVTIAVASFGAADKVHLELAADTAFDDDGTEALVEWLWSRAKRIKPVVIDAFSPARDVLEVKLKRKGMKVFILGANEYAQACSLLELAILRDKSITHFGQEHLTASLLSVSKKPMKNYPSSFTWLKADIQFDISPTVAVTCALFGALKFARRPAAASGAKKRSAIVF